MPQCKAPPCCNATSRQPQRAEGRGKGAGWGKPKIRPVNVNTRHAGNAGVHVVAPAYNNVMLTRRRRTRRLGGKWQRSTTVICYAMAKRGSPAYVSSVRVWQGVVCTLARAWRAQNQPTVPPWKTVPKQSNVMPQTQQICLSETWGSRQPAPW